MSCVACGGSNLKTILDLGDQPLANSYKKNAADAEAVYKLAVNLCPECFHLQQVEFVDPDLLFKNYLYVSGTTDTYRDYLKWFAEYTHGVVPSAKRVLDIGCNDGSQLDFFKARGLMTWGVDPAKNLAEISGKNHTIHADYFETFSADEKFDIVTAMNVVGHQRDPRAFLQKCVDLMHDDSRLFVQTSQANMVLNGEFDTIYHEHISFFNSQSMNMLAERSGLVMISVMKTPAHGESYVFTLAKKGVVDHAYIQNERELGLFNPDMYRYWAERVHKFRAEFNKAVSGKRLIGYGAAAKGNTLLNYTKVKPEVIIDDNPLKQGLYTPGMAVPIVNRGFLESLSAEPVCFLPLSWNFFEEIKNKIKGCRPNVNDEFIHPGHILAAIQASPPCLRASDVDFAE
jgi:SAM-dependent methyltransferase